MILLFASLAVVLLIGAPVFVAIGGAAAIYILANGIPPLIVVQQMVSGIDSFPLLAVPFFILAGNLMNAAAITDRLFAFARCLVGHLRGGLGHVNILASVVFSGMSGAAVADAGGLGTVELAAMKAQGYDTPFAVGVTAASSTMGPIIPPSLAMVVYGFTASVSIGQLFVAGIVPGILMALSLHGLVWFLARRRNYPRDPRVSLAQLRRSFAQSAFALMMPLLIVGGIIGGVTTPTEAAVVAVAYAVVIGAVVYRSLTLLSFFTVLRETFETTAVVMIMVASSALFGWVLVREGVARSFSTSLLSIADSPVEAMLVLLVILFVVGMFMETIAAIALLTPIFLPVLVIYGIDPVQFGVVMVLNLMIGLMTPPVGLLLFVMSRLSGLDLMQTFRATLPFMLPLLLVLLAVAFVPALSLTLPALLFPG
jgi:tripartite ATP-independent transporter DctM subunit